MRTLYPGKSGFKSETGGLMADIRNLTADDIRSFHKGAYRPDNLCMLIVGNLTLDDLASSLHEFTCKVKSKTLSKDFVRPWSTISPSFVESSVLKVSFPSDEESVGSVNIGFRGPRVENTHEIEGLQVLFQYLTDTTLAPLHKTFVECDEPYCSSVSVESHLYADSSFVFHFDSVPVSLLEKVEPLFYVAIDQIVRQNIPFDVQRMNAIIELNYRNALSSIENSPHRALIHCGIQHFLYGNESSFPQVTDMFDISYSKRFLNRSAEFWIEMLKKYIVGAPRALVVGFPSLALANDVEKSEELRIEQRIQECGAEKVHQFGRILESSISFNEAPVPEAIFSKYGSPNLTIDLIPVVRIQKDDISFLASSTTCDRFREIQHDLKKLSYFLQIDHIASNFVTLRCFIDTSHLSFSEKQLLEVYMHIFFESPATINGKRMSSDEVVSLNGPIQRGAVLACVSNCVVPTRT